MADALGDTLIRDTLVAYDYGIDAEWYLAVRAIGGTHDDAIAASKRDHPGPAEYLEFRRSGISHDQAMVLGARGVCLETCEFALRAGANHTEIVEFVEVTGVALTPYIWCRQAGATHRETMDTAEHTTPSSVARVMWNYTQARSNGLDHPRARLMAQLANDA
jgi:hypothetical protein